VCVCLSVFGTFFEYYFTANRERSAVLRDYGVRYSRIF